jgi:hypothetical protein
MHLKAAWNEIPIQQLCLRDLDSPYRQDLSARHQESQTGPLRNPSKLEVWEKTQTVGILKPFIPGKWILISAGYSRTCSEWHDGQDMTEPLHISYGCPSQPGFSPENILPDEPSAEM